MLGRSFPITPVRHGPALAVQLTLTVLLRTLRHHEIGSAWLNVTTVWPSHLVLTWIYNPVTWL